MKTLLLALASGIAYRPEDGSGGGAPAVPEDTSTLGTQLQADPTYDFTLPDLVDSAPEETVGYKHKTINRFAVGPFEFKDHILRVPISQVEAFKAAYLGLERRDQLQIVQLREIDNEMGVMEPRVQRGAVNTSFINAPVAGSPASLSRVGPNTGAAGSVPQRPGISLK